jgi:hypothetical protein
VVDYDDLMDAPVARLSRLVEELHLPPAATTPAQIEDYASRFLDPGLRHTRYDEAELAADEEVNTLVRAGYGLLLRVSQGCISSSDEAFWQQWEAIERGVRDLAPILKLMDVREAERRRAVTSLLGPLQALALLKPRIKSF